MRRRQYPACENCGARIGPGAAYAVILGDTWCKECVQEEVKCQLEERLGELFDQVAELVGVRLYEMEED